MFSELVVAYLFLGGTGAGALLIAAVLMLLADERAEIANSPGSHGPNHNGTDGIPDSNSPV